ARVDEMHERTWQRQTVATDHLTSDRAGACPLEQQVTDDVEVVADQGHCRLRLLLALEVNGDDARVAGEDTFEQVVPGGVGYGMERLTRHVDHRPGDRHERRALAPPDMPFESATFVQQLDVDDVDAIRLEGEEDARPGAPGRSLECLDLRRTGGRGAEVKGAVGAAALEGDELARHVQGDPRIEDRLGAVGVEHAAAYLAGLGVGQPGQYEIPLDNSPGTGDLHRCRDE